MFCTIAQTRLATVTKFRIVRFPSSLDVARTFESGMDQEALAKEYLENARGLAEALEPDGSGMHRTNAVNYGIVLSGRIWLELDDGMKKKLHPGDCVIQNGTRHAWYNEGEDPCVMAFIMIGAR